MNGRGVHVTMSENMGRGNDVERLYWEGGCGANDC